MVGAYNIHIIERLSENMIAKVYVVSHKQFRLPKVEGYYSILVGAVKHDDNDKRNFNYVDDKGDNISSKNNNYCELTGLYWMWKNSDADIIGLCHYRRFFTKSLISNNSKYYLTGKESEDLLEKYDVIVPNARYYKETTLEALNIAPNIDDINEIDKILQVYYPEYLDTYHEYLQGNKCYLFNMCIAKKEILNQYCEWLFDILFRIESEYPVDNNDPYRSRLFGFLSERLIYVWIKKNIPVERIKEVRVVNTDKSAFWNFEQDCKNKIRDMVFNFKYRK